MPIRPALLLFFCCLPLSCGRKPSGEFDQRPPIPTAPVAIPVAPDDSAKDGQMGSGEHVGRDLRNPADPGSGATDPRLTGPGPKAPTYTYVPVPSPRQLPGEKVSDLKPAPPAATYTDPTKPVQPPAAAPVTVSPPQVPGARPATAQP